MINRVILIGRLVRDPELRTLPSGQAMTRFSLAVDRGFANGQGQREADFIHSRGPFSFCWLAMGAGPNGVREATYGR